MAQIVVVEGFAAIRILLAEMFEGAGHTIFARADSLGGAQAVVAQCVAEHVVPIFVIGDLTLPRDRQELAESIREKVPDARIISCSLYPSVYPWSDGNVVKIPGVRENLLRVVSSLSSGQT